MNNANRKIMKWKLLWIAIPLAMLLFLLANQQASTPAEEHLIPVTGDAVQLQCGKNVLSLPCGSFVEISGFCGDFWATLQKETIETLPSDIAPYTFQDGISLTILEGKNLMEGMIVENIPEGAEIKVNFSCETPILTTLVWDTTLNDGFGAWSELSPAQMKVLDDHVELNIEMAGRVVIVK
ncbi:MAG: hypothetical protein JEZ06_13720 [Anaerolineaceae bacterium]|nr:hypothetical protein [Anaerolineaceae bacterium]